MSAYDIGRAWQAGLSNVTISTVNGLLTRRNTDSDDVNFVNAKITVF